MALENQPLFQAPSLPKMGKDSSPLMKGAKTIGFSFAKPKLKASKMSFVRAKKAKAIKAEDLKGPETVSTGSLAATLSETNRILVEIQNQLAIDFANRIAEKKSILQLSRKQVRKKKLIAKEDFVERGKGLVQNIKDFGKKVLSPVKGIFDKIVDFLTIIGTGIALNAAFEWLSDEENREKLVRVFNFLRNHWKTLLAIVIGGKILGLLLKLKGLFSLARSLTRRLKDLFGKNGKFKPGGEDFCKGVVACVISKLPQIILTLLASAAFINGLKPKLGIPDNPTTTPPTTPTPVPAPPPAPAPEPGLEPVEQPIPGREPERVPVFNLDDLLSRAPGNYNDAERQFLIDKGYDDFVKGGKTASPLGDLVTIGPVAVVLAKSLLALGGALGLSQGPRLLPNLARGSGRSTVSATSRTATQKAGSAIGSGAKNPIGKKFQPDAQGVPQTASPPNMRGLANREFNLLKKLNPRQSNLQAETNELIRRLEAGTLPVADQAKLNAIRQFAQDKGFTQIVKQLKDLGIQSIDKMRSVARSQGGTIPGKGPTNVDSVPAMLAPGEEVIKTSSANMFRPVLKDINNNAGRMFLSFKSGVEQQARNFGLQQEETTRSVSLFEKFGDLVEKQVRKLELKELEKSGGFIDLLNRMNNPPEIIRTSNTGEELVAQTQNLVQLMSHVRENSQPKVEPVESQPIRLEVVPLKPEKIQTYTHRRTKSESSGEGSIETMSVNLPPTVIQGPRQQQQAQPQEQPTESSSPDILISPMDMDNPFFDRSFSAYGVDL